MTRFVRTVTLGLLVCCSTADDEPTPAEQRREIMEKGIYCCTHNGEATTPECKESSAGGIYLADFSNVDASGHGDACGWILK